jgi:hypothetical protein
MPRALHEVLKLISNRHRESVNQIMIETIASHLIDDWQSMPSPEGSRMMFDDDELSNMAKVVELARNRIVSVRVLEGALDSETLREILRELEEEK